MRNMNFFGLTGLCANSPVPRSNVELVRDDSELHRICQLVYAPDEKTGLPSSDLMILFSDSVPADIADWVRKNLQNPHDLGGVSSVVQGQDIDDDTLLELTRHRDESSAQYIDRVNMYLRKINEGSN